MRAVVVYESMFGNTHVIADHVAEGLSGRFDVAVVPVGDATDATLLDADLLVVGGPTHVHGMSSRRSRQAARDVPKGSGDEVILDPRSGEPGLRDWIEGLTIDGDRKAAAFDTRLDGPQLLTGRASKAIARRLRRRGFEVVEEPESFLVDKQNRLLPGEADRAMAWGASLAAAIPSGMPGPADWTAGV